MNWAGHFINLDRSPERRAQMEGQLARLGVAHRYTRFPAIDGRSLQSSAPISRAEVGIFKSHMDLMRMASEARGLTHIVEDDVLLTRHTETFINAMAEQDALPYDVVVTDTGIMNDAKHFKAFLDKMPAPADTPTVRLLRLSNAYVWGMTSYLISPASAKKFLALAEREWKKGPRCAIDIVLWQAARNGELSIGTAMPFVSWLVIEHATASNADRPHDDLVVELVRRLTRYPLFIGRDMKGFLIPTLKNIISRSETVGIERLSPQAQDAVRFARDLLQHAIDTA